MNDNAVQMSICNALFMWYDSKYSFLILFKNKKKFVYILPLKNNIFKPFFNVNILCCISKKCRNLDGTISLKF